MPGVIQPTVTSLLQKGIKSLLSVNQELDSASLVFGEITNDLAKLPLVIKLHDIRDLGLNI